MHADLPSTAPTLATSALPARVRQVLTAANALAAKDLSTALYIVLGELDRELSAQAEQAPSSPRRAECLAELRSLRKHRDRLAPAYLSGLEAGLARLRETPGAHAPPPPPALEDPLQFQRLTLVEDKDLDRDIVLHEIARRAAQRGGTELILLGQRFGVLAGRPAFDAERLPVGPYALCGILREAGQALRLNLDSQLLLYRIHERQVMECHGELVGRLNALLAQEGVLPGLAYLPYRPRISDQSRAAPQAGAADAAGARPLTGWQGQAGRSGWSEALLSGLASAQTPPGGAAGSAEAASAVPEQALFGVLQGLLAERRLDAAPGAGAAPQPSAGLPLDAVVDALGALQTAAPVRLPGKRRRNMDDLRHAMLERVRPAHGPQARLAQEHADTFELLGMLYREIGRDVRRDAPAQDLLERLQAPLARAALQDRSFFLRDRHPARELLNAVAESGAAWLADDDADPHLVQRLERAVARVVDEYDGDEAVFERANREVQEHHHAQARKAEVGERRQVEAARGRDRLETAKQRAARAIAARLEGRKPPQFVQALLGQAWADVLTLTALRHGEDSAEWRAREAATARIVDTTCDADAAPDPELAAQIDAALRQVGYHADEAGAIARRLSRSDDDETTSRTELTARLKARARLGDDGQGAAPAEQLPPRTQDEQVCYERLRSLPFGTWFEFVVNQQGDVRRQRLSWYSPITDNALFVNARGQKIGDTSLDSVARLMAQGQARVVTEDRARLIDRAWQATLRTLRGLAGGNRGAADEAPGGERP